MNKKIIISLLIISFSLTIILYQNYIKNEENIKTNEYDKEDKPDALQYGNMLSLCIKAIQELEA